MAKTGTQRGISRRQSKRLKPEVVEGEDASSPEDHATDDHKDTKKVVEDEAEIDEAKGESDSTDIKPETADVQADQAESGPADVEAEDQAEDEPEHIRTVVEDKPETKEEPFEKTSTDAHPEGPLLEEITDGDDEMEAVIEVKGSAPTVSVSWEKDEQPEEPETEAEDLTKTDDSDISKDEQTVMATTDIQDEEEMEDGGSGEENMPPKEEEKTQCTEIILVEESEEEPAEEKDDDIEIIEDKEIEVAEDKDGTVDTDVEMESSASENDECENNEPDRLSGGETEDKKEEATVKDDEMEAVIEVKGSAPTVSVSWEKDEQPEEPETEAEDLTKTDDSDISKVSGKRKAASSTDSSPSKKVKLINDGYCLYVGNLDNSKYYKDIRNALENYFMAQSVLVQDIRLDKTKKYAFVDLVSEIDLTKALRLKEQKLFDKPLKIAKAKVKEVDLVKKKDPEEVQKRRNERCIHVENIPSSATKEDVLKVFPKAVAVRFLGGTENPSKGVAFVQFQSKDHADAAQGQNGTVMMQDCALRVNAVMSSGVHQTKNTQKEAPPRDTLFVSNLPSQVQIKHLKKIFKEAVQINIPQRDGKSRGYAFVEFESVAHAQIALKASKNRAILKQPLKVQFGLRSKPEQAQGFIVPPKTLIVLGLHQKTTVETLREAFEGASASRIFVNKDTGRSKKFGFVDFESTDLCASAKEAAEDMEIDGKKVTVAFARPRHYQSPDAGQREEHREGKKGKGRGAGRPPL